MKSRATPTSFVKTRIFADNLRKNLIWTQFELHKTLPYTLSFCSSYQIVMLTRKTKLLLTQAFLGPTRTNLCAKLVSNVEIISFPASYDSLVSGIKSLFFLWASQFDNLSKMTVCRVRFCAVQIGFKLGFFASYLRKFVFSQNSLELHAISCWFIIP